MKSCLLAAAAALSLVLVGPACAQALPARRDRDRLVLRGERRWREVAGEHDAIRRHMNQRVATRVRGAQANEFYTNTSKIKRFFLVENLEWLTEFRALQYIG